MTDWIGSPRDIFLKKTHALNIHPHENTVLQKITVNNIVEFLFFFVF